MSLGVKDDLGNARLLSSCFDHSSHKIASDTSAPSCRINGQPSDLQDSITVGDQTSASDQGFAFQSKKVDCIGFVVFVDFQFDRHILFDNENLMPQAVSGFSVLWSGGGPDGHCHVSRRSAVGPS